MTIRTPDSRNSAQGKRPPLAAAVRARQIGDLSWLFPLIPIALLTGFMLAIVIKPV